jgi:hypothetical protein
MIAAYVRSSKIKVEARQARGLRAALSDAVVSALVVAGAFGSTSLLLAPEPGVVELDIIARPDAMQKGSAVASVPDLLRRHGCWSDGEPAGVEGVPGHVVLTWPGAAGASYAGGDAVGVAFGHVFDIRVPGLVVHGFCP